MYYHLLSDIPEKEIVPGFFARMVHLEKLTVAHFRIVAGSTLPEHAHHHEQITNVIEGQLEMTVGGQTQVCTAGMSVTIPAHVPHSGRALTDCRVVDVFSPVREDYR
ncbi:MAG: cupin domain-containing protein [Lewinella sp.]|nr:cupin domain-containing protein [Lewinella sp.]